MSKRRLMLWLLAVALLAAALYAIFHRPAEPSYQGRSLSNWLADFDKDLRTFATVGRPPFLANVNRVDPKAVEAIRQIGTNALPLLLSWLNYDPPEWNMKLHRLLKRTGIPWTPGLDKELRAWKAQVAFQILGPRAQAAIPELSRRVTGPRPSTSAHRALLALACLGEAATPPLVSLITNQTAHLHLRLRASESITFMGTSARPAVPALLQCLQDQDREVRGVAALCLGKLKLEPRLVVPALATTLQDTSADVRYGASYALGNFAAEARSATPALLKILTDPEAHVRKEVTNALRRIAPEVLTNAPPK